MRRQAAIRGKRRIKCSAAAEYRVRRWVEQEAERAGCSMSIVWITCAEYVMESQKRRKRRGKGKR